MGQKNQYYQVRELSQLLHLLKRLQIRCVTVSLEFLINLLREYYRRMVKNPSPVSGMSATPSWPYLVASALSFSLLVYKIQIIIPILQGSSNFI